MSEVYDDTFNVTLCMSMKEAYHHLRKNGFCSRAEYTANGRKPPEGFTRKLSWISNRNGWPTGTKAGRIVKSQQCGIIMYWVVTGTDWTRVARWDCALNRRDRREKRLMGKHYVASSYRCGEDAPE